LGVKHRTAGEAIWETKRLFVLVRQRKALAIAVRGEQARRRWSKLREWLALNA
jgi:exodeoxyribonuclease V alpha subunit